MTEDPAFALARHVTGTDFDQLPETTVAATKRDILDTFGCILGGAAAPAIADKASSPVVPPQSAIAGSARKCSRAGSAAAT